MLLAYILINLLKRVLSYKLDFPLGFLHSKPVLMKMKNNLGRTSLERKKRNENPLLEYDRLPNDKVSQ